MHNEISAPKVTPALLLYPKRQIVCLPACLPACERIFSSSIRVNPFLFPFQNFLQSLSHTPSKKRKSKRRHKAAHYKNSPQATPRSLISFSNKPFNILASREKNTKNLAPHSYQHSVFSKKRRKNEPWKRYAPHSTTYTVTSLEPHWYACSSVSTPTSTISPLIAPPISSASA